MEEKKYSILVVDDEESMREFLAIMLHREGYKVTAAEDGAQALVCLNNNSYDLIISDIQMPRLDGFKLLKHVQEHCPETVMIMITAFSTTEEAVEAMKNGAYDYIIKPFKNEEIRLVVKNALERKVLRQENTELKKELGKRYSFSSIIGKSKCMQQVYDLIAKVADTKANVLITGESGTGKELVARAVHYNGKSKEAPFVAINCGAIPENLLESELFGHEKGSFTGATNAKVGLFEAANGGTIFLDEIGELPALMQVKLLRVLQEREIRKVGGTKNIAVNVRLIVATNKELEEEVAQGNFREDLFYRINVIRVDLPPLRARKDDIPLLIEHFYKKVSDREESLDISSKAMKKLLDYHWPGNIRELENVVERCVILGNAEEIQEEDLPAQLLKKGDGNAQSSFDELPDTGLDLDDFLGNIEKDILLKALDRTDGVRKKAAELLKISFRSMRYRLAKYDIDPDGDEDSIEADIAV
ncbi:MAG: sigma-54-dependent Fis family transcriptional regulator [Deltaproteobacteria bacterium]|nr:sigma-54-dependent Fis family transcriptional regulator [Deltaproteobacteria bacterium]